MSYSPRNTSQDDPFLKLLVAMDGGGIEAQERQGQRELLRATTLPTDTRGRDDEFIALGFTFGDKVPGDDLFREATLPEGWKREGSDHAMHSYIVDERGIKRVNVFYKAAFYDRKADMHIINVGGHYATEWIYGEGEPSLPDGLTDDERAAAAQWAEGYLRNAEEYPDIYGDRKPRAESLLAVTR